MTRLSKWTNRLWSGLQKSQRNLGLHALALRLLGCCKKGPVTAPIIGATKISHLEEAFGALDVKLTEEDVNYLEEPYVPYRVVAHQ